MGDGRTGAGLHTIFAIFLGLMVTSFVGVGVYTFYPPPDRLLNERLTRLTRDEQAIRNSKAPEALTPEDRAKLQALADQRAVLQDEGSAVREAWARATSIILITFATIAMAISIVRAQQMPVISNGLLLGGVFTMLYGVGWSLVSDTSIARFAVVTVAMAVTLGLGYVRFVRQAGIAPAAGALDGTLAAVDARLRSLEERMDEAARAFGRPR